MAIQLSQGWPKSSCVQITAVFDGYRSLKFYSVDPWPRCSDGSRNLSFSASTWPSRTPGIRSLLTLHRCSSQSSPSSSSLVTLAGSRWLRHFSIPGAMTMRTSRSTISLIGTFRWGLPCWKTWVLVSYKGYVQLGHLIGKLEPLRIT